MSIIKERLTALRQIMAQNGVGAFMIPTSDYHNSEYVGDFFKVREFYSGFTGSNGTLVVLPDSAYLWTDGRYFVQAEGELAGTDIELMRMGEAGVPKISDFIFDRLSDGDTFAFDGRVVGTKEGKAIEKKLAKKNIKIRTDIDPADNVWNDRPAKEMNPIWIVNKKIAGDTVQHKLNQIRDEYKKIEAQAFFLSKLDDIAWTLNIRGNDIECNPVAIMYLLVEDSTAYAFVGNDAVTPEIKEYFERENIKIKEYDSLFEFIKKYNSQKIALDEENVNYHIYKSFCENNTIINLHNPTENLKAIKNETELANIRKYYEKDSAQLTRFIYWIKSNINQLDITEYEAAKKLDSMRAEIEGFIELSFPTIAAYGSNAAMMHYEATEDCAAKLKPEGLFLVDSGAQYMGATTDVTRTIVLGEVSDEIKKHYTLSVVGMLRLAQTSFLEGCTGRNLDILARKPLWDIGIDYKCGTGHGIGYILNVHEGPQNIRWRYVAGANEAVLKPGMIVSDEPGVYIEGSHGIRIENILEIVSKCQNDSGHFLSFKHLTYVPIDLDAIDIKYMEESDRILLNDYHKAVYQKLKSYMRSEDELKWLEKATQNV